MVRRSIKFQNFGLGGTLLALLIQCQGHLLADPNPQFPEIGLAQANERITGSFKPAGLHYKVRFPASHLLQIQNTKIGTLLVPAPGSVPLATGSGSAGSIADVEEKGQIIRVSALFGLLGFMVAALAIWWMLERHWNRDRRTIRALNGLGEELLWAKSHGEALTKLREGLPNILNGSSFRIFLLNKSSQTLECAADALGSTELTVGRESPLAGAVFAFRNKTLLTIPDTRQSPLLSQEAATQLPAGLVYIPMVCAGEPSGVLEISYARRNHKLSRDVEVCAQHLGNQAAIALELLYQREVRKQLVHSEKLSATGQLMAGIADEITGPLQSISQLSSSLLRHKLDSLTERTVRAIGTHAGRATGIVARLTSISNTTDEAKGSVDLAAMIRSLLADRDLNTKSRGIRVDTNLAAQSVMVAGHRGQLEQVFRSLLIHAEQQQDRALPAGILVGLSTASKSVLVRIEYSSSDSELMQPKEDSSLEPVDVQDSVTFNLDFCRGILNAHDGNIHLVRNNAAVCTFEVELPLAETKQKEAEQLEVKQNWTVLVIEPDGAVQRKILGTVSALGHRVIPVVSAEEAADLMDKLRFDVVFCSVRLPGRTWRDFYESIRHRPLTFVLVTEGIDEGLSRVFEGSKGFLLRKPLADQDLEQLLRTIQSTATPVANEDRDTVQPVSIS